MTQLERNRENRWRDEVPSGWAPEQNRTTLMHRAFETFYTRIQYAASAHPGRQKDHERYASGYVTPAEEAYGEDYQFLPKERAEIARKRGKPQRRGLSPQADGFETPLEEI